MFKKIFTLLPIVLLGACVTSMEVTERNADTGYYEAKKQATIVSSKSTNLDSLPKTILVPGEKFSKGQIENIGYFTEVMTFDELEEFVLKNDLTDKVPSVREKIGIKNAAKHVKPFLWLHYDDREEGTKKFVQLVLTDPDTLEDLLVSEIYLDYVWNGVNDQHTWYPLFNSLIDYLDENSEQFSK